MAEKKKDITESANNAEKAQAVLTQLVNALQNLDREAQLRVLKTTIVFFGFERDFYA